VYWC